MLISQEYPDFNPHGKNGRVLIPRYDIRGISTEPWSKAMEVGEQIVAALRTVGTVLLWYPEFTVSNRLYQEKMRQFYRLAHDEKMSCARRELHYQTGWTPPASEKALGGQNADAKQRFFYPAYGYPPTFETRYAPYLFFEKVVPSSIPGWQDAAEEWITNAHQVAADVCHVLDAGLVWEPGTLADMTKHGPHLAASTYTRYNFAFCTPGVQCAVEHWDLNTFSLHIEADESGLYGRTGYGYWYPCNVPTRWFAVMPAFQLFYKTAGYIPYTLHTVAFENNRLMAVNRGIAAGNLASTPFFRHSFSYRFITY